VLRLPKDGPPVSMVPSVRQPLVGSPVRVTGILLEDDDLRARFECDGDVYTGTAPKAQPVVGEWMTLVAVGLHGRGLYVDLAGSRALTLGAPDRSDARRHTPFDPIPRSIAWRR